MRKVKDQNILNSYEVKNFIDNTYGALILEKNSEIEEFKHLSSVDFHQKIFPKLKYECFSNGDREIKIKAWFKTYKNIFVEKKYQLTR